MSVLEHGRLAELRCAHTEAALGHVSASGLRSLRDPPCYGNNSLRGVALSHGSTQQGQGRREPARKASKQKEGKG